MAGRPRDPELEKRLLDAGWALLTSRGYDALTMAKVAAEAQAHRTDLYRRWPTKAQLVVDVLAGHLPPVSEHDTGTLRGDLKAIVDDFAESWSSSWVDGLMALTADLHHDPDAELAFRTMAEGRGRPLHNALTRAMRRGEIGEIQELGLVGDLIEGPLMHRRMIGRQPLTPEYLDAVVTSAHRLLTGMSVTP
ncbi:TetR/AcrR family transcriptional regulator [Amycolatopsis sp. NPDC059657]|uniref:TetR/AcrR family transcriptional regulator n=1 Tax=Amycolatopsis sp. NPDC059657 TaxID=3346899 RepID=UPI00366B9654